MTETTIENYQERAARTMPDLGSLAANGAHMALGITTEFGEMNVGIVMNDLVNIREEHGDMAWYLANSCNLYGLNFQQLYDIAKQEFPKLFALHDIVDLHKREFAYGKEMDIEKLREQLIIAIQKLLVVSHSHDFSFEESLQKNIDKLYQRFPNKFTQEDALDRDLDKEREILE